MLFFLNELLTEMQLDISLLIFKFLNPLHFLLIPVFLFTLASSSLNKDGAIEHCTMRNV